MSEFTTAFSSAYYQKRAAEVVAEAECEAQRFRRATNPIEKALSALRENTLRTKADNYQQMAEVANPARPQ